MANLVKLITLYKQNKDEGQLKVDREIDKAIYKIYCLTFDETCAIEGSTEWMPREEYEAFTLKTAKEEAV